MSDEISGGCGCLVLTGIALHLLGIVHLGILDFTWNILVGLWEIGASLWNFTVSVVSWSLQHWKWIGAGLLGILVLGALADNANEKDKTDRKPRSPGQAPTRGPRRNARSPYQPRMAKAATKVKAKARAKSKPQTLDEEISSRGRPLKELLRQADPTHPNDATQFLAAPNESKPFQYSIDQQGLIRATNGADEED